MSAYVVDNAHISYLVQAAITMTRPYGITYGKHPNYIGEGRYDGPQPERIDERTATAVGSDLLRENIASVMHRYPDDAYDELPGPNDTPTAIDYRYRHSQYVSMKPVDILKAIAGYEYQSCEHAEWETSNAKAFCDNLRNAVIRKLSGFDDSEYWSVTDEMSYPTRDQLRARVAAR